MVRPKSKPWTLKATFVLSAASLPTLPRSQVCEVAFVGRSNVGKSSLLNAVAGAKALARVSNTPGRTQTLNCFRFDKKDDAPSFYLIDMPGYGFARAPKARASGWLNLIERYIRERSTLRRVFLLIDARRGMTDVDAPILGLLKESGITTQVVLTKADALKRNEVDRLVENVARDLKHHVMIHPKILVTSVVSGIGIETVRDELCQLAGIKK